MENIIISADTTFLTPDEINRLTGRKWKAKQLEFLRANGIPFTVNARKEPIILRSAIESRATGQTEIKKKKWQPSIA